ncbi:MAG: TetR/AcrR family transcriptional regulator [Bdellovibrio sp.]
MSTVRKKLLKDDIKYLLFSEMYLKFSDPKKRRKAFSIIEAAVHCFAKKGFEKTTLDMVAREAGIARSLLNHYFKGIEDIRLTSIKYVRLLFQNLAVEEIKKGKSPTESIKLYVQSCFHWTENFKSHGKVWVAYLGLCISNQKHRELNSLAVQAGEERITALLNLGKSKNEFSFDSAEESAKIIQTIITGAMITLACENHNDPQGYKKLIIDQCLTVIT